MIIQDQFEQGTEAWYKARIGIPTASNFDKIMPGKRGAYLAGREDYMMRLACERILGRTADKMDGYQDTFANIFNLRWGIQHEDVAIEELQKRQIGTLVKVGFCTTDDHTIGASPDRMVKGKKESVEIKCPRPWTQMEYLTLGKEEGYWRNGPYYAQVQGQMLVTGYKRVHFYSFHPRMPGKYRVTERDDDYIALLRAELLKFNMELNQLTTLAREQGFYRPYKEGEEL